MCVCDTSFKTNRKFEYARTVQTYIVRHKNIKSEMSVSACVCVCVCVCVSFVAFFQFNISHLMVLS